MTIHRQNWAGHVSYCATQYAMPESVAQLQAIVRAANKVRVIGARHSFNPIHDCPEVIISLDKLDKSVIIDQERHTATVNAGITYHELCPQLEQAGYALHNLASLDHITVIGACMTATHGSGDVHGNLATGVSRLEMVTATGDLVTLSREKDGDQFLGAVVALGALGVVTKVTLDLVPSFLLQQDVYEKLPMTAILDHFDAIMGAGYSVSLFPDWQSDWINTVWVKQLATNMQPLTVPTAFHGAALLPSNRPGDPNSDRVGTRMGQPGPWHERLPHFSLKEPFLQGNELQSEYFVARRDAVAAMQAVIKLRSYLAPILQITEVRTVAADKLWLSPAYEQDIVGIHFNWHRNWPAVQQFLPLLEETLAPFQPKPHWGKLFAMTPAQVQAGYPRLRDFQALAQAYDPQGKFHNEFLDTYLFAD
ncbi:MAG: FAD-binding protein [Caldilineaceae bacterium]|nr:FAD-binding protein [Caldilineaceae bacterium]